MSGWIKLHRVLAGSAIGNKPDYLAVWVHLLLSATHRPREILVGRQIVQLSAGQLVFGRKSFSAKTGVSEAVIRSALDAFKSLKQITIKTTTKYSVITVVKWSEYQSEEPANNLKKTSKQPAVNHKQEGKELQEEDQKLIRNRQADHVPCAEIIEIYARVLPGLPQLRIIDEQRLKAIRSMWRKDERFQSLEFWEAYFLQVKGSSFLMGWNGIGFDWLLGPKNFKKVVEGNYEDKV